LTILTEKSETSGALRSVLTNSVMQKLIDVGSTSAVDKYTTLLYAFGVDGALNGLEKKVLQEYAKEHGIDKETHEKCLAKMGWTPEEYRRGVKGDETKIAVRLWNKLSNRVYRSLMDSEASPTISRIPDVLRR
jgi:hypothetical protein